VFRDYWPVFLVGDNDIPTRGKSARCVLETFFTSELTQFPKVNENTWFQKDEARNSINALTGSSLTTSYLGIGRYLGHRGRHIC
jgi:hypothetical protein